MCLLRESAGEKMSKGGQSRQRQEGEEVNGYVSTRGTPGEKGARISLRAAEI